MSWPSTDTTTGQEGLRQAETVKKSPKGTAEKIMEATLVAMETMSRRAWMAGEMSTLRGLTTSSLRPEKWHRLASTTRVPLNRFFLCPVSEKAFPCSHCVGAF